MVSLTLNLSSPGATVERQLLGHNIEFTRHDLFAGLSAELLANRKFATLATCTHGGDYACWPASEREIARLEPLVPRWSAIGHASLDKPYWASHSKLVSGDLGHSVRCTASSVSKPCGISQSAVGTGWSSHETYGSAIVLHAGVEHTLRLVMKTDSSTNASAVAELADADGLAWRHTFVVSGAESSWQTLDASVRVERTTRNATLSIRTADDGGGRRGSWWLGSASLMPSNAWRGMRRDVVAALNRTRFRGLLRYPGGCFAPFYRWRVGLLPSDERPPISTPPNYCSAVAGGANAFTDGALENGIAVDDYLALCAALGMEPAISVRLQVGSAAEVEEAAAWVEYVNGDARATAGGRLRASRGHPAPYGVRFWYLGNEISQQQRYPGYPADRTQLGPPQATEYAAMLARLVPAMRAASPAVPLRLVVVGGRDAQWNAAWMHAVGPHVYATSLHSGYLNEPPRPYTAAGVSASAQWPRREWIGGVKAVGAQLASLGKAVNATVLVSADEWGLGPPWRVGAAPWQRNYSVVHAMYAAGLLGAALRGAEAAGLAMTNYFEPVNEGAVRVGPFESVLSPVGEAMGLYAAHAGEGAQRLVAAVPEALGNLDVVATVPAAPRGEVGEVIVTIAHLNATIWRGENVTMRLAEGSIASAAVQTLRASGFDQASTFVREKASLVAERGAVRVLVPPFSVVQVRLRLRALYS